MIKLVCAIALALVVTGCAGTKFSFQQASQVRVGMTEAEVIGIMGRPYSVLTQSDSQRWIWSYANGFSGKTRAVSMDFVNGRVSVVPNIPSSFVNGAVQPVQRNSVEIAVPDTSGVTTNEQHKQLQIRRPLEASPRYDDCMARVMRISDPDLRLQSMSVCDNAK